MRAQFTQKNRDILPGYREALIGEKMKAEEDEGENQASLEAAQGKVAAILTANAQSMSRLSEPGDICFRNTKDVNQQIADVEDQLQNQYLKKLTSVWRNDSERVRGRMAMQQSKMGRLNKMKLLHGSSDVTMAHSQ